MKVFLIIAIGLSTGILHSQTTFCAKNDSGAVLPNLEVTISGQSLGRTNNEGKIEVDVFKGDTIYFISKEMYGEYIATENDPKALQEIECMRVLDVAYAPLSLPMSPVIYSEEEPPRPGYELRKWFSEHLSYPQSAIDECRQGKCYARFEVEPDGSISNISVRKGVPFAPQCDSVVVNMLSSMPKWTPHKVYGKAEKQIFMVSIRFVLEGKCGPSVIFSMKTGSDHPYLEVYHNRQHVGQVGDDAFPLDLAIGDTVTFVSRKWYYQYVATKVQVTEQLSCLRKADAVIIKPEFPEGSFSPPDVSPKFPGGKRALKKWLSANKRETDNTEKCRFYMQFTVEPDGKITNHDIIEAQSTCGESCYQEVFRLMEMMPDWSPALENGKPVRTFYTIPIEFEPQKKDLLRGPIPKPEVAPQFPGGKRAVNKWVRSHMKLPKKGKRQKMILRCTIETDGSISEVRIVEFFPDPAPYCFNAKELCKSMPKWIPAQDAAGNPVRAYALVTAYCTAAVKRKLTNEQIKTIYR